MKSFLEYVADDIIRKYGCDLSRTAVVFPNKRAALFLSEYLARRAGQPVWSPAYITISDLSRQHSTLTVADPVKLVCDLHRSFCAQTGSTETLNKFYGWGQLLLSDFDDIDKNMADADRVFANLRDIHELDDVSYLTPEQRDIIRRFFSNFTDEHNTELKERFLRLWSHFAAIYHDYNRRLADQGLAYEGALYRQVATAAAQSLTSASQSPAASPFSASSGSAAAYDRYLFVGFNLIQKAEQQLFAALQREGKARFYWDFDHYYMQHHEAGRYIARYLEHFPNELPVDADDIYRNFQRPKHITYISAPTENVQARYISTWLREQGRIADGRRTAIVLCNEGLLQTVIHCLPDEVGKVNITTGYPLSQTPVASLIQQLITLRMSQYPPRHLRTLRRHPYARYIDDAQLTTDLPTLTAHSLLQWLTDVLRQVATRARDDAPGDPLFEESLFRAYTLVNRLRGLAEDGDLDVDIITLQRLMSQLVQSTTIPFHGEPAEGLQVMGVLETRNLDFDHVLLLSCNEGNMPRGVNDSSFIPHSLRHAYELTTIDNKVAIYAYYFHRLLQRAGDVTLVYNSATEDGHTGERSRFMLQLLVESRHSIRQLTLQTGLSVSRLQPVAIAKTPHVMQLLHDLFDIRSAAGDADAPLLTPTAINRYMRCPVQFYYRYVSGLKEPDLPDDEQELDNRIFGNIFHEAADLIYHQLPQRIERPVLVNLLKTRTAIERAVDEAFHRQLPNVPYGGLHLINREVIIHYLRQLLEIDLRLAPFTIIGLEHDVSRPLSVGGPQPFETTIGGRIDRLDLIHEGTPQERIRVVDYKTGSQRLRPLPDVEAIFQPDQLRNHSDYYLQTFVYADIVRQQQPPAAARPVSPALLFIQHAAADDYDPTLHFGREPISDVADHAARFNELLHEKVDEIFHPDMAFTPTADANICRTCPYARLCGQ